MSAPATDIPDMAVESVDEDGTVVFRFSSGLTMQFVISSEMVPYYRRLVDASHPAPEQVSY